jgi:Ca-activated chloride channel family protein
VSFSRPAWLIAGLLAGIALVWLWRFADARRQAALTRFISAHLRGQLTRSISVAQRRAQRGLVLGALLCLCVALAGPLMGFRWEQISRRGNEIIFAIDTSRSMSTPDVKPSRLARAKLAIDDFVKQLDGDAVGIVAFAGSAFLVCPLTLDYGAFHESLSALDTGTIPRGGTNISSAIHEAQAALHRRPSSDKILILVTDGEDLEGDALDAARNAAKEDGLKIYAVGVGTASGDLIPVPLEQGGGFVKDDSGAFVKSKLDEAALKAIAGATGGFYAPLGTQGEGLDTIFKSALGSVAKHDLAFRQQKVYTQRYQWPLAASLVMLLMSLLMGTRRRRKTRQAATPVAVTMTGFALLMIMPIRVTYAQAANGAVDAYNAGTAMYKAGQFPQAAQAFQQSITRGPSSDLKRLADQEDAYYNLGNTLYRNGQKTEQSAPQETIKTWTEAVKAYDTALQLRADDADSKYNRDLVKRKIDALKQQQNQNPQQNKGGGQQGQPPPQGQQGQQPPPQGQQGQPPPQGQQGQPPPQGQQGQPPPQGQQGQPPPQGQQGQPPPQGQQGQPPPQGQPSPQAQAQPADDDATADSQRQPGQMSREEARELLDSAKGDERHTLGVPVDRRDPYDPQEKPLKNW